MTAVIYARYSSSSQREASIEEQVRICKQFADRNGYMVAHVYKDSAITGKTDKRPEFQLLLKECTKKPFDAVIVYSIDRFGRNLLQSLGNASKIEDCGICLLSATEVFTNKGEDRYATERIRQTPQGSVRHQNGWKRMVGGVLGRHSPLPDKIQRSISKQRRQKPLG